MYTKEGKDIGELFSPASQGEPADPVGFLKAGKDIGPLLCKKGSSNALPYKWVTTTVTGTVEQHTWDIPDSSGAHTETVIGIATNTSLTSVTGITIPIPFVGSSTKSSILTGGNVTIYSTNDAALTNDANPQIIVISRSDVDGVCILNPIEYRRFDNKYIEYISDNLLISNIEIAFTEADVGKTVTLTISICPAENFYDVYTSNDFTYTTLSSGYVDTISFKKEIPIHLYKIVNSRAAPDPNNPDQTIIIPAPFEFVVGPKLLINKYKGTNYQSYYQLLPSTDNSYEYKNDEGSLIGMSGTYKLAILAYNKESDGSAYLGVRNAAPFPKEDNTGYYIQGITKGQSMVSYPFADQKIYIVNTDRLYKYVANYKKFI